MKKINVAKSATKSSSIQPVSAPDGKVSGIKSNTGVKKSAIEGKEKSEGIMEQIYLNGIDGINNAEQFAQRELEDYNDSWRRLIRDHNAAAIGDQRAAAAQYGLAGGVAGLAGGIGSALSKLGSGSGGAGGANKPKHDDLVFEDQKNVEKLDAKGNPIKDKDPSKENAVHSLAENGQNQTSVQSYSAQDFDDVNGFSIDSHSDFYSQNNSDAAEVEHIEEISLDDHEEIIG